jgi:hypothetical protein
VDVGEEFGTGGVRLDRLARDVVSESKRHSGNDGFSPFHRIGILRRRLRGAKGSIEERVYRMCASCSIQDTLPYSTP